MQATQTYATHGSDVTARPWGPSLSRLSRWLSPLLVLGIVSLAVMRIHMRVQTTLVGYEIGRLKTQEAKLLEERSTLKMQLAKLTTKKHLQLMTDAGGRTTANEGTYALK